MDRRKSKIRSTWQNGIFGKIFVIVSASIILSIIGFIVSIPIRYQTKVEARVEKEECIINVEKAEKRNYDKINKLENDINNELKRDRKWMRIMQEQLINNSKMLERIDERTKRMDRKLNK